MTPSYLHPQIIDIESFIVKLQYEFDKGIRDGTIEFGEAKEILIKIKELKRELNDLPGNTNKTGYY